MNLDSATTSVGLRAGTTGNVSFGLSTIGERKVIQVHTGGEKLGALLPFRRRSPTCAAK